MLFNLFDQSKSTRGRPLRPNFPCFCKSCVPSPPAIPVFPLFRLPNLPLRVVLDGMRPSDLTLMCLCSEKTQSIIKASKMPVSIDSLSKTEKDGLNVMEKIKLFRLVIQSKPYGSRCCFRNDSIRITINITDSLENKIDSFHRSGSKYYGCFPLRIELMHMDKISTFSGRKDKKGKLKIDDITVPVRMTKDEKTMRTFWEDPSNGLKILINYFKELFNSQTIGCIIDKFSTNYSKTFSRNLRGAVNAMNQHTIGCCEIKIELDSGDYKFILDNVKPTIRFSHSYPFPSWINDFRHETSFESQSLKLCPANCFTLENLITTNCESIHLEKSILTSDDISKYFKLWIDGKYPKLKKLTVQLGDTINVEYIHSELQSYSTRYEVVRDMWSISIKQHDVTVATITKTVNDASKYMIEFSVV